jgi:hypothetical protein
MRTIPPGELSTDCCKRLTNGDRLLSVSVFVAPFPFPPGQTPARFIRVHRPLRSKRRRRLKWSKHRRVERHCTVLSGDFDMVQQYCEEMVSSVKVALAEHDASSTSRTAASLGNNLQSRAAVGFSRAYVGAVFGRTSTEFCAMGQTARSVLKECGQHSVCPLQLPIGS